MSQRGLPPGAQPFSPELRARIDAAMAADSQDVPRTRHRDGNRARFTNRLLLESSPYLRQHAHNPVNWYPWGDAAFEEARILGRPVFLSIGYSTCHWCHVMEEESFEDLDVARLLNERYVAIKVDREERPDVDAAYMIAVQALTRHGGWPMSVWLDAQRRPYFAGTYFPLRDGDRGGMRGLLPLLAQLAQIYAADPERVSAAAASIVSAMRAALSGAVPASGLPGERALSLAAESCRQVYDPEHGGTRGAPKFPSSLPVRFLLREHRRTGEHALLAMAERTLEKMAAGGIHDQLGGGFHRYSTDARWLVPHFEKMLYDNALLAVAFAEAWQVTKRPDFARVLRTTLDYVERDMTSSAGGFFSATDADSEGEEGAFFVWSEAEIRALLNTDAQRFIDVYGVTPHGNFEGKNVLFVPHPDEAAWEDLSRAREVLRVARERRPKPLRDDKIVTAWNGLMISAMAAGARVLREPRYAAAASRAMDFVLAQAKDGRLQRSWRDGRTSGPGFLEDYAFVVAAALDLYDATFERRRLADALALAEETERLFGDADGGAWFRTAADQESLVAREKPQYDGAEPTGASVAARNALRLYALTGDERLRRIAERALCAYGEILERQPLALHEMLLALEAFVDAPREVVLVWPRAGDPAALVDALAQTFLPTRVVLAAPEGEELDALARLTPLAAGKTPRSGLPTAYVCERGTCRLPVTDAAAMRAELASR